MEITLSKSLLIAVVLAPLFGSIIACLFGRQVKRFGAQTITILGVAVACGLSMYTLYQLLWGGAQPFNQNIYTFFEVGQYSAHVGFMVDKLTAMMMVVVTFVSLLVHIYTIGYMQDDPGYQRFFSYISLFTFSMLTLVMSNNFLQLFFGWEAVGLVSYLLIGFWFKRPTAIFANMKAFLVNRVGDFGFLLGISRRAVGVRHPGLLAGVLAGRHAGRPARPAADLGRHDPGHAAAERAGDLVDRHRHLHLPVHRCHGQVGPGPAACVAAGLDGRPDPDLGTDPRRDDGDRRYLHGHPHVAAVRAVADRAELRAVHRRHHRVLHRPDRHRAERHQARGRVLDPVAAGLHDGCAGRVGLFGCRVPPDDPRLLQGPAVPGRLLVIIAMHHEQDMRKMGGLRKYMPITFITMWIGTLALVGTPFFSGFYSKDTIIEAAELHAHLSNSWVATYGYWAVLGGVIVTSFYSFRLLFLTFHGKERFRDAHDDHAHGHGHDDHHAADAHHGDAHHDDHGHGHGPHEPHETQWVVTLPLILLAIPSIAIGFFSIGPMLYGTDWAYNHAHDAIKGQAHTFFTGIVDFYDPAKNTVGFLGEEFHGPVAFALHGMMAPAFMLTVAGFLLAALFYLWKPDLSGKARKTFAPLVSVLENKYGFDKLWIDGFAGGSVKLGKVSRWIDSNIVDGVVNLSARVVDVAVGVLRRTQSGFLYHYAFAMIIGLIALLGVLMHYLR